MIGGCTKVVQDVLPYMIADGNPAVTRAVNLTGLQKEKLCGGFDPGIEGCAQGAAQSEV